MAGFKSDEIDITAQQNVLIVAGKKVEDDGNGYIHRGIATRSFERRFGLADHVKVKAADLKDGLLAIDLVREIPEEMKPRKIKIGGDSAGETADDRGQGGPRLITPCRQKEAPGTARPTRGFIC